MKTIRLPLAGLTLTLLLVVAASVTTASAAHAQGRASLTATARVVDAGPGWLAHTAALEALQANGNFAAGAVTMTDSRASQVPGPRPVIVTTREVTPNASDSDAAPGPRRRTVTVYVEHVAN